MFDSLLQMYRTIDKFATIESIAMQYLPIFILLVAVYVLGNGILHDVFVLMQHKEPYDRNLLRLLMDGHILISSGIAYIIAYFLLRQNNPIGLYLCIATALSLLVYCGMIFPFLKSYGIIAITVVVLAWSLVNLLFYHPK